MSDPGRRRRGPLVALAAIGGLLLTGCSATWEIRIGSDTATVSLLVEHSANPDMGSVCRGDWTPPGLAFQNLGVVDGRISCTVTGSIPLATASESWLSLFASDAEGALQLVVPSVYLSTVREPQDVVDVTIHFPGQVIASNGTAISDTSVRWNDIDELYRNGLAATVLTSPARPWWLLPAGAGMLVGAIGSAGLAAVRGRGRRRPGPRTLEVTPSVMTQPSVASEPPIETLPEQPPEDPHVWSQA